MCGNGNIFNAVTFAVMVAFAEKQGIWQYNRLKNLGRMQVMADCRDVADFGKFFAATCHGVLFSYSKN